ncbi:MAG: hypothetical protein ABIK32_06215 [Chloroflexota bacterium]|nr:hypothetical protein [Chloroflexota bacterium]
MMEIEFIILTIALIVLSLLSVYCGVKFVIGFVAWKKLRAIRQNIPNGECEIAQKQGYQKANGYARSEGVQISPFCISADNPNNNAYEYGRKYTIANPFKNIFISHIASIISRVKRCINQKQIKPFYSSKIALLI